MKNPNAFAHYPLDRAGHHRRDPAWLEAALASPAAQVLALHRGQVLVSDEGGAPSPGWLSGHAHAALAPAAPLLFLGVSSDGAAFFAMNVADVGAFDGIGRFEELRPVAGALKPDDLAIIGAARAVFEWHARNGFCAQCGTPTQVAEAGWRRDCPACKAEHYPRVDPVAIMTPVIGDRCFLARQRGWPRGMYSALAGYIEPGETFEQGASRETLEEAGLRVTNVRLHSNQPWPFPHSLMIGVICEVENDRETVDVNELESGRWFTRDEARQLIAGNHADCFCPPKFAIAHQLIKAWAEEG
ncbi:MAG: NAD(+) diphosphatase [Hyphomonadaceae bacterium]|nr:NAD(+) diphosphatase [Hyphomonadaceae bacterium]